MQLRWNKAALGDTPFCAITLMTAAESATEVFVHQGDVSSEVLGCDKTPQAGATCRSWQLALPLFGGVTF